NGRAGQAFGRAVLCNQVEQTGFLLLRASSLDTDSRPRPCWYLRNRTRSVPIWVVAQIVVDLSLQLRTLHGASYWHGQSSMAFTDSFIRPRPLDFLLSLLRPSVPATCQRARRI